MTLPFAVLAVLTVLVAGIIPAGSTEWYQRFPYFDKLLHVMGGFAIAWFLAAWFARDLKQISATGALVFIVGAAMLVGFGWELAEHASNLLFSNATDGWQAIVWRYFHGGGLTDTLLDLIADGVGATALGGLYLLTRRT